MKNIISVLCISFMLFGQQASAQENVNEIGKEHIKMQAPIFAEIMGGDQSSIYQVVINKKMSADEKFGLFNLTSYDIDYDEHSPNAYIIQTIAYYELFKDFNIGAGSNLKSFGGFKPLVSASYSFFSKNIALLIQPSYELDKNGEFEVFSFLEIHPHSQKKFNFYGRLQLLTAWSSGHAISSHAWRAGVSYKNMNFGPAFNVKYIGAKPITQTNVGAFFNILIKG